MRLLARAGLLTLCWLPLTVGAARPFVPIQPSPLAESWRWHAQEALDGMSLTDCLVGDDGSIWFVSQSGLVLYDGGEPELFPAPKGLSLIAYRTGAITSKGVIYMLLPGQILEFKGGNYRVIFSFEGRYDMLRGRAVLTADDTVLFGTPEGIVAVRDGTVRVVAPDNRRASFLLLDSRGDLWTNQVGTGVVFRCKAFSHENGTAVNGWESFQVIPGGGAHLSLVELPDGSIWCANDSPHFGIQAFDPASGSWMPVPIDADGEEKVHLGVDVTPDGTVMIYGDKRILLQKDGEIEQLTLKDFNFPITSPFVRSLKSGSMIIGGRRERVYLVDCSTKWWETFKGINYFCSDTAGRQWFISFSGEIICRDITSGEWTAYDSRDGAINTPLTLATTPDGKVWAAGRHDNIAALSIFGDSGWEMHQHPEMGTRFSHQSLFVTRAGSVILGCGDTEAENLPGKGGLLRYDPNGRHYTTTHYAPPRVPFRVVGIQEGPDGTIWIGGPNLRRLDDFKAMPPMEIGSYGSSWVDSFLITESGEIWIAQWGLGIHVYDPITSNWIYSVDFNTKLSRGVVDLHEDPLFPGQIWAATSDGFFNFDKDCWVDEPLSRSLSLLREGGSLAQSPGGTIWLNASSRNWHFRDTGIMPGRERFESQFKTVAFKRYDVHPDTRIVEYEAKVYEPGLSHFKWIGECGWSIAQSEQLSFSYRLDGGEWTPYSKRMEVVLETHRNGQHAFELRARTPFGQIDPTPASVGFQVIPVLWKQPWFILTTLAVVFLLIGLLVVIVRQRIHHLLALEEYKIQFFTNLSHELRTPLMVILGPLETLFQRVGEKEKKHVEIAQRNARKLVVLIDRLLDFRKAQLGKIQMQPQVLDLALFIKQEIESLRPLAEQKEQRLTFLQDEAPLRVGFDPRLIEVILDNLLGNAIKYTPKGGKIDIQLRILAKKENQLTVSIDVVDTGPGIPRKELKKVFDPFYQVGGKESYQSHSTGIGLAHTRGIVEAVGGRIRAESPVNQDPGAAPGTRFVVELSLQLESSLEMPVKVPAGRTEEEDSDADESAYSTEEKPLMLIVEDNDDIREYLHAELESSYAILLAENGATGWQFSQERIPDIVVSDVLMPVMDGRELCRKLKSDQRTSHIPLILLTALKSEAHELAGLETGADDYITKPVNVALMRKRIENLLLNRRKVREFISANTHSIAISKEDLPVNKVDQEFMAKFVETIESNLRTETFDVEELTKRMFMSRMTLYRKVKALTGESPGSFIRSIRLKKAAQYLATGSWTVSQVIEQVGFSDMSYFSNSFKKAYHCTPTEYIERYSTRNLTTEEKKSSSG